MYNLAIMKLETLPSLISEKFDNEILFVPKKIQIVDGGLTVHWEKWPDWIK